jgi:hypothetical protein
MLKAKDNKAVEKDKAVEAQPASTPEKKPLAAPAVSKGVSKITRIDY